MAVNSANPHEYLRRKFPGNYMSDRGMRFTLFTPAFRAAEALFVGVPRITPQPPDLAMEARPQAPTWGSQ